MKTIPCYDIYELALDGPSEGNPFLDVTLSARFQHGSRVVEAEGFYDGGGVYRLRCMPDRPGEWTCTTRSNIPALDGRTDSFTCTPARAWRARPGAGRHARSFCLRRRRPLLPGRHHLLRLEPPGRRPRRTDPGQPGGGPFQQAAHVRFPKALYLQQQRARTACLRTQPPAGEFDFTRFNPDFFRHLELRIGQLAGLGIEADLILFHPYDRWGYANMPAGVDDRYLRYLTARLAAYRNVWWSFANEWDLMTKPVADWDRFFQLVQQHDPVQHLRSIHNCRALYDHAKPWVTHVSYQTISTSPDMTPVAELLRQYGKPVVVDEACYEGNIPKRWGNITAQEMVRRFWDVTALGGTCGHGETYLHPEDILWWSKGGTLHGHSPARLAFYRKLMEQYAPAGLDPAPGVFGGNFPTAGSGQDYYLVSFGLHQPGRMDVQPAGRPLLPPGADRHLGDDRHPPGCRLRQRRNRPPLPPLPGPAGRENLKSSMQFRRHSMPPKLHGILPSCHICPFGRYSLSTRGMGSFSPACGRKTPHFNFLPSPQRGGAGGGALYI